MFDEKEIYLQIIDPARTFECVNELNPNYAYHLLIREWDP